MKLNYILNGDCLDLLKGLPDESVDLIVTSPPYNIGKEYEKKKELEVYLDSQKKVIEECYRVLKKTGSIFWQVGSFSDKGMLIPLDIKFFPIFEGLGMIPRNRIIWVRSHGLHAKNKFSARHETILWFTKSGDYKFFLDEIRVPQKYQNKKYHNGDKRGEYSCNPEGKNPGDIWAFRNVKHNHEEQTIHPCQFPEDLIERVVFSTTEEGDVILDPYMGTGTVATVAKRHDRNYLGAELDDKYYEVAMRRISGTPDENGVFPNLRTLREYVAQTGESIEGYSFQLQKGKRATEKSKSKIYPEQHHLKELEKRLDYEESFFSAKKNEEDLPESPYKHLKKKDNSSKQARLFE
ncbi:DNA-methyltransferase [Calothrix rhizosoleniae]|uniref:DNA-methyltransferase n=1 Tax=Calothrix rhizosoleniae TaxID=888997 RepID=UPI000B4A3E2E|nr:site-specific DNA-methyltransferase [Calothrix rhizosoleniae]